MSNQTKLAPLALEPRTPLEKGLPADRSRTEKGLAVQRTISRLQESQDPEETEPLLVVKVLTRSLSSHLTPETPRRPSVIRPTPPTSPSHRLSPYEPSITPPRSLAPESDSVFSSPTGSSHLDLSSYNLIELQGSSKADSGDSIYYNESITAAATLTRKMAELMEELEDVEHEIEFNLRNFPASGLDEPALIEDYDVALNDLKELSKRFSKGIRKLTSPSMGTDATVIESWKAKLTKIEGDLNLHRREVRRRALDLKGHTSGAEAADSTLVRTSTVSAPTVHPLNLSSISTVAQEQLDFDKSKAAKEKKLALAKAKSSTSIIKDDLADLTAEYTEHFNWIDAEDSAVQKAMRNIDKWKEKFTRIRKETRELEGIVNGEDLDELTDEMTRLKTQVSKTETELDEAVKDIKEADAEKGLLTDRRDRTTPVQFPTFSGSPGEDYLEFSTKFEKAIEGNKIPKSDQLDKLREQLRGKAKNLVPVKTESIEKAWDILKSAFGDPMILLKFRKQGLLKLGSYPESLAKSNPQKVVEWCLELERLIDDFIKLGDRELRLEMVAYNDDTINSIVDLFPMRLVFRIEKQDAYGKDKLDAIVEILEEERKILQRMALRTTPSSKNMSKSQENADTKSIGHRVSTIQPKGLSMFTNPRKLPSCRICMELEKRGDNRDLYESHQGNFPTHCPRWAAMSNEDRSEIAKAAKFCLMCMDPKITYNGASSSGTKHKCITNATKNRFSCSVQRCCFHSWVCLRHREENRALLERFHQEMQKRKMTFTYFSSIMFADLNSTDSSLNPTGETCSNSIKDVDATNLGVVSAAGRPKALNKTGKKPVNLSVPRAIQKLQELTPEGQHLVTELKDPPLFMFSYTTGKHSDVQIFYDTGNSHVLFKDGTPENLYGVKIRTGPFPLGAVGDTTVWGGDEWACQPLTTKGHREILIGLTVPKITSNFPYVNLREATAELKASAPHNVDLQKLRVPDFVGGECHVLLGIQYSSHFPRLVHSLDSGLGIYEVKLHSHYTAAVAGPHSSFNLLAGKLGNVALLLKKFTEGIDHWKDYGAPAPKSIGMTSEELKYAYLINRDEICCSTPMNVSYHDIFNSDTPVYQICLAHAARKVIDDSAAPISCYNTHRSRIQTDTRDDLLDDCTRDRILLDSTDEDRALWLVGNNETRKRLTHLC